MECPLDQADASYGYDIIASFNSDYLSGVNTWDFSLDGWSAIDATKLDFVTVVLHELIHGLGECMHTHEHTNDYISCMLTMTIIHRL